MSTKLDEVQWRGLDLTQGEIDGAELQRRRLVQTYARDLRLLIDRIEAADNDFAVNEIEEKAWLQIHREFKETVEWFLAVIPRGKAKGRPLSESSVHLDGIKLRTVREKTGLSRKELVKRVLARWPDTFHSAEEHNIDEAGVQAIRRLETGLTEEGQSGCRTDRVKAERIALILDVGVEDLLP